MAAIPSVVTTGNDVISGGNDKTPSTVVLAMMRFAVAQGDDTLSGDAGADTIYGESGDDTLSGGADDDIFGGEGSDFWPVVRVTIRSMVKKRAIPYGNGGSDTPSGDAGADTLYGEAGLPISSAVAMVTMTFSMAALTTIRSTAMRVPISSVGEAGRTRFTAAPMTTHFTVMWGLIPSMAVRVMTA